MECQPLLPSTKKNQPEMRLFLKFTKRICFFKDIEVNNRPGLYIVKIQSVSYQLPSLIPTPLSDLRLESTLDSIHTAPTATGLARHEENAVLLRQ
jgi:hypothetical protein